MEAMNRSLFFAVLTFTLVMHGQSEEWLKRGLQRFNEKLFSEALAAFDRFKEVAPKDPRPYFYSGMVLAGQRRFQEAASELKHAMRLAPEHAAYPLGFADVASQSGQDEAALEALDVLEQEKYTNQLSAEGLWLLSQVYYRLGKFEDALRVLKAVEKKGAHEYAIDSRRGDIYLNMGEVDRALQSYQEAIQRSADPGPTYYGIGVASWLKNELRASREALLKAVERNPSHPEYLHLLGVVSLDLNEPEKAIEYLRRAEHAGAQFPKIYDALGRAYRRTGNTEKAREYLKRFQEIDSARQGQVTQRQEAQQLIVQAAEHSSRGEAKEARLLLEQAIVLDSDHWEAHRDLARIYLSSGDLSRAYRHLSSLEHTAPDDFEIQFLMASYWYQRRNLDRALSYAEKAKAQWPGDAELRNLLGNIYFRLDRAEKALEEYRAAVRSAPERSDFQLNYQSLSRKLSAQSSKD